MGIVYTILSLLTFSLSIGVLFRCLTFHFPNSMFLCEIQMPCYFSFESFQIFRTFASILATICLILSMLKIFYIWNNELYIHENFIVESFLSAFSVSFASAKDYPFYECCQYHLYLLKNLRSKKNN